MLEGGTTIRLVYVQKFWFMWLTVRPAPIFAWFVPSSRIFLVKAVYMVLGSSYLAGKKILALGTSTTFCM